VVGERSGRPPDCSSYFVGAMYPVTRARIPEVAERFVHVMVARLFFPSEKPGVANKTAPLA
jgi:hypothetical protein